MSDMHRVHRLFQRAVAAAVRRGMDEREAFAKQLSLLRESHPAVHAAYVRWLLAESEAA